MWFAAASGVAPEDPVAGRRGALGPLGSLLSLTLQLRSLRRYEGLERQCLRLFSGGPLRIVLYTDYTGGVFSYSRSLVDGLSKKDVEVHVATHPPGSNSIRQNEALVVGGGHAALRSEESRGGLRLAGTGLGPSVPRGGSRRRHSELPRAGYRQALAAARKPQRVLGIVHLDHSSQYRLLAYYQPLIGNIVSGATIVGMRAQAHLPRPHGFVSTSCRTACVSFV